MKNCLCVVEFSTEIFDDNRRNIWLNSQILSSLSRQEVLSNLPGQFQP